MARSKPGNYDGTRENGGVTRGLEVTETRAMWDDYLHLGIWSGVFPGISYLQRRARRLFIACLLLRRVEL